MIATRPRLGLLISGGGRTAINIHEYITRGELNAEIAIVISSRENAMGAARLRERGLRVEVVERKRLSSAEFNAAITTILNGVDLVCMCGFLSLWRIPPKFAGRVLNIHPALLPLHGGQGMYGEHVHAAVLKSGATTSGCTVHYCDNKYDHGPIIFQRTVPVLAGDTPDSLGARVFQAECEAYPVAIRRVLANLTVDASQWP